MATTFDIDGKVYELHLTRKSLKAFERVHGSIMSLFSNSGGNLSLDQIDSMFSVALYFADGGKVSPQQAVELSEEVMDKYGYMAVNLAIAEVLERDCAFLLRGAESQDTIG